MRVGGWVGGRAFLSFKHSLVGGWVGGWVGGKEERGGWVGGWVGGLTYPLLSNDNVRVEGNDFRAHLLDVFLLHAVYWVRWVGGWVGEFLFLWVVKSMQGFIHPPTHPPTH